MPSYESCRKIDLSLSVEGVEQGGADRLRIGWQVVELLTAVAGDAGGRHIEVAGKVKGHRAMQNPTDARDVAFAIGGPDPLEHLIKGVGVGEDMVRGLPVGVLVGVAKARHSERRAVSKRLAEVRRSGAGEDCRLESVNDIRR